MPISSPGLASGIDIKSIVSQLVALERAPLAPLQQQAASFQSKLSIYGTIKSMVAGLGDAAAKLSDPTAWDLVKGGSTAPDKVGITVSPGTAPTSMSIEVQSLARSQSNASIAIPVGSPVGSGTLSIQLGSWATGDFVAGSAAAIDVAVTADDTLSSIATKMNAANAGISATVLRDASGERLLVRSQDTGEDLGFRIQVADDDATNTDTAGLSRLAYDKVAGNFHGMTLSQAGVNAQATVNNVPISSASNTVRDALPGITLNLLQVTTTPVDLTVFNDKEGMRKNLQSFVDAYNAINNMLATATKYDPDTKVAGSLQGDSTAVGLQNALRGMMRSVTPGGSFTRLLDIGIEIKNGGTMSIDAAKLDTALNDPSGLKTLFTAESSNPAARGFGLKMDAFADGLLAANGLVTGRAEALKNSVTRNTKEQDRVADRAARAEVRLLAQYNAMDAAVGRLNGLSAFVNQQVTLWNKSTG
ncbi:MAG: flagellar filament capping protein FliD [Hydrogenophaga sp.]|uniref:flagellar filament capping protein FliD n=1 Tax=Hydrogenophaga sp. TaxID=1904254 RepID=UPI002633BF64|nr:flagellar filament capping protein FliD [Hydrogenophaga sp.]MDM7944181.1 flagellar filament capping protein FliD [Hydrogenophaga sp.]